MNKTLHQKLSDKTQYPGQPAARDGYEEVLTIFHLEKKVAHDLGKDLLSPRPQAVSRLLDLSRSL